MQRVTLTLDDDLVAEIDQFMERRGYQSRSEAVRDVLRSGFRQEGEAESDEGKSCVAALVYVYDRETRELPRRLAEVRADHHDLLVSTTGIDLDHTSCFEVALMRGQTSAVRRLGDQIVRERGVRHGKLVVVPVDVERETHQHGSGRAHSHEHFKVRHGS